jgi:hypothetical protein
LEHLGSGRTETIGSKMYHWHRGASLCTLQFPFQVASCRRSTMLRPVSFSTLPSCVDLRQMVSLTMLILKLVILRRLALNATMKVFPTLFGRAS